MNSNQTFSREFLQSMPEKHKQDIEKENQDRMENVFNEYIIEWLTRAAKAGKTYYLFNYRVINAASSGKYKITDKDSEDYIPFLKKKFPDSKVYYEEKNSKYESEKKVIRIDWS